MEEGDPGYLDYLPSMYREAKPGSPLVQTVRAIALTHLYNSGNFPEVKSSARKYYGEALATINKALHDPVERLEDDIMLSIWLMQLYEAREVNQLALSSSQPHGSRTCKMKSLPMPSPCMSAVERTRVYQEALRLKEIAMHLQRSSLDWPGCRDGKWKPRFVSLPIMLPGATQLCSREAEYFQDSHAFRLWSVFRGTMIVLHETLLKFGKDYAAASIDSQHLASGEDVILWDFERSYCVQAISSTADEILNTLPFVFGEITNVGQVRAGSDAGWGDRSKQSHLGVPAIWFLRMIKSSMYTSSTQKALATEDLYKIGRRMGIRQALTVAGA
ncbi:hypothetical protein LTR15_010335 [Elasticomyces elasticus]|nr:hypothetical protein LTR15_010335 [Elasticomyces elasticus]